MQLTKQTNDNAGGTEKDALLVDSGNKQKKSNRWTTKTKYATVASIIFITAILVVVIYFAVEGTSESSSSTTWSPPTPCDPLVDRRCYLPWPNDYWLSKTNGIIK